MRSILLAKRLGMQSALHCAVRFLPDPGLSETVHKLVPHHLKKPFAAPRGFFTSAARSWPLPAASPGDG